uniref:Uncharacterized protein n=1 Tax=Knipowitschia caucasica TaxID=637954 RepID=A0AAV2KVA7_KNICA
MADLQGAQASGPQDKMEEIAGMMKSLMSSQYTRDKMVEKERTRQEQRWNAMQDQVQELQQQLMRMQTECSAHPEPTSRPATAQTEQRRGRTTPVLVNGHCAEALLDSGCFQTVVRSSLVPLERQSPEKARLICIHGDEHNYPTGEVYLTVGGQTYLVNVALAKNLPFAVILGNDIPTLPDLIIQADSGHSEMCSVIASNPCFQSPPEPAKPCNILTRAQIARGICEELPFCDEELAQPCKARKPRAQKRREKFVGSQKEKEELSKPLSPVEFCIPSDIGALQKEDSTLKPWFDKVEEREGVKTGKGSQLDEEPSQQFLVRAVKDEEITEKFFPVPPKEPAAIDLSHLSPPQQDEIKPFLNPGGGGGGVYLYVDMGGSWDDDSLPLIELQLMLKLTTTAGPID